MLNAIIELQGEKEMEISLQNLDDMGIEDDDFKSIGKCYNGVFSKLEQKIQLESNSE